MNLKSNDLTKRYSIFPITHPDLWEFYKKAEKQTWVAEEIDLSKDKYNELNDSEKLYLKNILAFFAISDGLVIDNLATNFISEVDLLEAQYFYGHQTFIEQVHANGYSLLIESYVKDEKDGQWCLQSGRDDNNDFESDRIKLPESWRGLRNEELEGVSGVKDAIFCHRGGWFAVAGSKEGALLMAQKALDN